MRERRGGFTLVELLLTLGVVVIGLTSVIALVIRSANASWEHRNLRRMDRFAETVFASVRAEGMAPPDGEELYFRALPVFGNSGRELRVDGEEDRWPGDEAAEVVSQLVYTLRVEREEVAGGEVIRAVLRVRPFGGLEFREYLRLFPVERRAW